LPGSLTRIMLTAEEIAPFIRAIRDVTEVHRHVYGG
jgi:hypothetical protein